MLYVRFPLAPRNVDDLLHERGIDVSHETIRYWWQRFDPMLAYEICKRRIKWMKSSRWKWRFDDFVFRTNEGLHYLRRAVDHEGNVVERLVTKAWDKKAALKFPTKARNG